MSSFITRSVASASSMMTLSDARCFGSSVVAESEGLPAARYSRDRRDVLAFYQRASRWLSALFQRDDSFLGTLRDATFPAVSRLPFFERRMIETMAGLSTRLLSAVDTQRWRHPSPCPPRARGTAAWSLHADDHVPR